MARFSRLDVLNTIVSTGLVPVFYHGDAEVARQIAAACAGGGARVLEFTNRGDMAPEVYKDLSAYLAKEHPHLILGVGTVVDEPTAALYLAYGANFVVGPVLHEPIARLCNRRKVAYMPGCGSATEIANAEELGVEIVKVFPGDSVGGPSFVKAMQGPSPWTRIMPTGGVDASEASLRAWFKSGVAAVGIGSNLIRKESVQAQDWAAISAQVRQVLDWIKAARGEALFLGVEHVGLYPTASADAQTIAAWYGQRFGFQVAEGSSSIFAKGPGTGRIEIMKDALTDRCHLAVRVSNFEQAVAALQAQGVELAEPKIGPGFKAVFLKETDPSGNLVHLLWTA